MENDDHRTAVASSFGARTTAVVALGGAIGALVRWAAQRAMEQDATVLTAPTGLPWGTLVVNLVGCAGIGIAAAGLQRDTTRWAFVVTGVLGGFTTMSAFAVESNALADAGRSSSVVAYVAITLCGGYLAVVLGEHLGRRTVREPTS